MTCTYGLCGHFYGLTAAVARILYLSDAISTGTTKFWLNFFFSKFFQRVCYWKIPNEYSRLGAQDVRRSTTAYQLCTRSADKTTGSRRLQSRRVPYYTIIICAAWRSVSHAAVATRLKGGRTRKTVGCWRPRRRVVLSETSPFDDRRAFGIGRICVHTSPFPPISNFSKNFSRKYLVTRVLLVPEFLFRIPAHFVCRQNQIFPGWGWNITLPQSHPSCKIDFSQFFFLQLFSTRFFLLVPEFLLRTLAHFV